MKKLVEPMGFELEPLCECERSGELAGEILSVTATPLGGGPSSTGTLNVTFSRVGQTLWFRLS
jgi:hypothetical protein